MLTYSLLNIGFIAACLLLLRRFLPQPTRAWYLSMGILLLLTAVFDNLIIMAGIVGYDPAKLLGIYLFQAPIEDFLYSVLAIYIVPALWTYFGTQQPNHTKGDE